MGGRRAPALRPPVLRNRAPPPLRRAGTSTRAVLLIALHGIVPIPIRASRAARNRPPRTLPFWFSSSVRVALLARRCASTADAANGDERLRRRLVGHARGRRHRHRSGSGRRPRAWRRRNTLPPLNHGFLHRVRAMRAVQLEVEP